MPVEQKPNAQGNHSPGKPGKVRKLQGGQRKVRENGEKSEDNKIWQVRDSKHIE